MDNKDLEQQAVGVAHGLLRSLSMRAHPLKFAPVVVKECLQGNAPILFLPLHKIPHFSRAVVSNSTLNLAKFMLASSACDKEGSRQSLAIAI